MLRSSFLLVVVIALAEACGGDESASWQLTAEPEGTTLQLVVEVGVCNPLDHINVTETSESVTVNAYTRDEEMDSCPAILIYEPRTLELSRPLGDRVLRGCGSQSDENCISQIRRTTD